MTFEDFSQQVLEIRKNKSNIALSKDEQEEAKNRMDKIISEVNELNG